MAKKARSVAEIQQAYEAAPKEIRAIIDGPELLELIPTLGVKHHLHVDQMGVLEGEITDVLVGFEQSKDFTANVMAGLGVDETKAAAIAQDVNEMLFVKIREAMKKNASSEKSVVMPSAAQTHPATTSAPAAETPTSPVPKLPTPPVVSIPAQAPRSPAPTTPPKPTILANVPEAHATDTILSQPTVSLPPKPATPPIPASASPAAGAARATTPKPATPPAYKVDPYREPPE
jgi:hypothetical protein